MFEMTIQQTYVGITGFTRREQVRGVLDHFEDRGFVSRGTDHVPMIGLLISPRNLDKKWFSSRYPPIEDFNDLIDDAKGRSFLTIHVDEKATSNWVDSLIDLGSMIDMKHVDGIQVNVKHPSISPDSDK
jgi:hypothetical protein